MAKLNFKYQDESSVYIPLIKAVNQVCIDYNKDCTCTSGYRSLEKQKIINAQVLQERKSQGAYQLSNGAVYTKDGKCWASAYGQSNHNYCIALDISDEWFKVLTNAQLKKYGLIKPMSHEPWHVQLIDHQNISQSEKEKIRDNVLSGKIDVKTFQSITGLVVDGISGPKTQAKAKEVLQICQTILKNDFQNAGEVIAATQNDPSRWLDLMKTTKYFDSFIMNIVKRMGGKD
jgi:hypothetical protein